MVPAQAEQAQARISAEIYILGAAGAAIHAGRRNWLVGWLSWLRL
jgi:hypothetical protein